MRFKLLLLWLTQSVGAAFVCAPYMSASELAEAPAGPTVGPAPICSVQRERYVASPDGKAAPTVAVAYLGTGLRRREIHSTQSRSDIAATMRVRYSNDNGRTWSDFSRMNGSEDLKQDGNGLEQLSFALYHDSTSGRTVEMLFQRIYLGDFEKALQAGFRGNKKYFDHSMYRLSRDDGRTWTQPRQLVYEEGAPFNPDNWADPAYLKSNQMYGGDNVCTLADGRLAYPAVIPVPYQEDDEDRKVCRRVPWMDVGKGYVSGVLCMFGTWNKRKSEYDWTHSGPIFVPRRVSTRGLLEPALAQLTDGRLLLEMRGSNAHLDPLRFPARKWISLSQDGGKTWSPATDLRYDTGEHFYAPSSSGKTLRGSKTGKLYWVGNISRDPAQGNGPRYPLYIAEVGEKQVALKKSTLTVIDDRGPADTAELQLSNFSLLENRETKELEVYLTRYGERPGSVYDADVYKYTLRLLP